MDLQPKPQTIDASSLAQGAAEAGFMLLQEGRLWRLYRRPKQTLVAHDVDRLLHSLACLEDHVREGGEAAGLLHYEAGYALEAKLRPILNRQSAPLAWFGLYDKPLLLDLVFPSAQTGSLVRDAELSISREQYGQKLDAIHELIAAGEVYQINFTDRVRFRPACDPWTLFVTLCKRHPVPYAAFVNTGDKQIISLSPELFFAIEGMHIRVRPMKGTAPRGLTLQDDQNQAEQLLASEKNRAENVMIVDLLRNDLGRICETGSVRTTRLFEAERFPSLWQMTSTVEGKLRDANDVGAIARALFPSGSVTGAPKIRAMEHIARLEGSARGIYTGAIGYFAPRRAQFNVAIRTICIRDGSGTMGVGSGITYDSSALAEWEECEWKSAFLTQTIPDFRIIETLAWRGDYDFVDEHLARMRSSSLYFGFAFDHAGIRRALQECAARFGSQPQRVRILLSEDGTFDIESSVLHTEHYGRVCISRHCVSSRDRFLYHKTTNRQPLDGELTAARSLHCDDALFFNERGELTEGAIHNVFVQQGDTLLTPPVPCGLLPGVFREHLLRTRADAREAVLTLDDLVHADTIYLCNSVRGMYPVQLVQGESRPPTPVPDRDPSRRRTAPQMTDR